GAYTYQVVGGANAPSRLARPVEDTLFFAGEATIAEMSGTVPAAVISGRRAARRGLSGPRRRSWSGGRGGGRPTPARVKSRGPAHRAREDRRESGPSRTRRARPG